MKIQDKLFGVLKSTTRWNRFKERTLSIIVTLMGLPLLAFYMLGRLADIGLEKMFNWENTVSSAYLKKEKEEKK